MSIAGLLSPILFMAVQKMMLAERMLIHFVIYFSLLIALLFSAAAARLKNGLNTPLKIGAAFICTFLIVFLNLRMARKHHN